VPLTGWVEQVYLASPLCTAVLLNDRAIWIPALEDPQGSIPEELPSYLFTRGLVALAVGLVFLAVAQAVFSRLEGRFAEKL